MGLTIYGTRAVAYLQEAGPDDLAKPLDGDLVADGVTIGETFGPIVYCEDGCGHRVRFNWRHDRQLCDACGGPPVVHGPTCPARKRAAWACDCGAR